MYSHSTIVSYILFILSCTTFQFVFLFSLFLLFCYYNTNISCPCSTDVIHLQFTTAPQEKMVTLPIRILITLVPPSHPRPIWPVSTIQPLARKFLPLYQPAQKKPVFPSKTEQTDTIQRLL